MDPLDNERTSKVFYCFASGFSNSLDVARILNTRPPAVSEHLDRLLKFRYVKKGQKTGKFQSYVVNWDALVRYATEAAPHLNAIGVIRHHSKGGDDSISISIEGLKRRLKKSLAFEKLLTLYITAVAIRELEFELSMTVKDYVGNLERALVTSDQQLSEPELREWRNIIQEVEDFHKSSFTETIEELKKLAQAAPSKSHRVKK